MSAATGAPYSRVDGPAKVTGAARYAAEFALPDLAHGAIVQSTIAKGRITGIDTAAAERAPGVLAVITHANAPRLPYRRQHPTPPVDPEIGMQIPVLQDDLVRHNGQYVGLVVAETLEQATCAADLVRIAYEEEPAATAVEAALAHAFPVTEANEGGGTTASYRRGDPLHALAGAPATIDRTYVIARENHNPIEAHATIAAWDGERLVLHDKTQWPGNVRSCVALTFGIPEDDVRVISPFVGGAFGSALRTWPHVILAAMAAREVGRPVKIVLTRRQMYYGVGHRPYTIQRVALGAERDGRLLATVHDAIAETSCYEEYTEQLLDATRMLYRCDNLSTLYRLVRLNINTPTPMRAPGHVSGLHALECAMDELAVELGIDPVELRLRNHAAADAAEDLPWSSKSLDECLRAGAERFGWDRRNPEPRSMHTDGLLVGWGMAGVTYPARRAPAAASARILRDGSAIVRSASSDMGPGTYTSMTQIAADALGLALDQVRFELGDTSFAKAPVHGGSMTMASLGPAVHEACLAARRRVLELARGDGNSPLHGAADDAVGFADGRIFRTDDPAAGESYGEILQRHGSDGIEALGEAKPGDEAKRFSMHSFGAVFAEVHVDPDFGTVRVPRLVGAFGIGRVINPKIVHSQCIGGMVGGIGMALLEDTRVDPRFGRVTNANLAEYLVPVHADVQELDVLFVDEHDPHINPLGAKGVAEIAICGVAPAIANAVYHATGRRVRDLPITPEKLL
jgi:xanthine dehydrogenase YagR molybdenum-binding subunit